MSARVIELTDGESRLILESLAGLCARSGVPSEVTAAMHLAQRIEGFETDGRPGSKRLSDKDREAHE